MAGDGDFKVCSGNAELDKQISQWLSWDKSEKDRAEVVNLCARKSWGALEDLFLSPRLTFGTAGLRGEMRPGPAGMNELLVLQTAQGLLSYASQPDNGRTLRDRGIVIGYDGRYHSKRFAEITASIFLHADVPVWLFEVTVATPFIPHAVLHQGLALGVMVTASHNPKEDNGYKVYWNNGAQIKSPHDKNIQNAILQNLEPWRMSWDDSVLRTKQDLLKNPFDNSMMKYYSTLDKLIPDSLKSINQKSNLNFVYTAMHGVGFPYIQQAFEVAKLKPVISVKEQQDPNPDFPTVKFPNPEEGKSSLDMSIHLADEMNCKIILANDPDADRLACAEKQENEWHVFTGNELGALLGWWSLEVHKLLNPNFDINEVYMLASTVSSKILRTMSEREGFHFIETLTGFKWMGNEAVTLLADNKKVLFAFEEAIGFMWGTGVLDKDGVSAAALLATLACYLYETQKLSLKQQLIKIYEKYGYHVTDNSYYICRDQNIINKIFERIRHFPGSKREDNYPHAILNGKYEIDRVQDLSTGYDSLYGKTKLPASKSSQIITFYFKNGFLVTLRTSGTEPKLKYYSEMCAKPELKDWSSIKAILIEMVAAVCEEFLQPKENALISRAT